MQKSRGLAFALLLSGALSAPALALGQDAALRGIVRDVSGALMQTVPVQVFQANGDALVAQIATDTDGAFAVALPAGEYRIAIEVPSFARFERVVAAGSGSQTLAIVLNLAIEESVDVTPTDELIANTMTSLTSMMLAGDELLDLPTNEEDLARYLLLLAGADFTGDLEEDILANFVVDGFDDDRLPRPNQISQIIIDPNPMTANGGGRPRIEIVTRPGTGMWRRSVDFGFADESLNALTPGETRKEPRQTRDVDFEVEGPIIPNVMELSFQASTRTDERAGNSLRAVTPTGELFSGVVQPEEEREFEVGVEFQLNASHRLDVQFSTGTERSSNDGVGGFTLPERASNERGSDWAFQVSERTFGASSNNNFRFKLSHSSSKAIPVREGFAIDVADAFEGGGGTDRGSDDAFNVRLENTLRLERGDWNLQVGGELLYQKERNVDQDNYNGTFEFASLDDYCMATGFAGPNCAVTERIVTEALGLGITPVAIDGRGREVGIIGLPTTFTQAFGNAELEFSELSFEAYVQADRRFGRDASLRLGLRYDATNHSRDFLRLNLTVNAQYRLAEGTLLSAGAQLFFQDFRDFERLLRNDGSTYETELFISSPSFPDPFRGGTVEIGDETASLWVLDPAYQSPFSVNPQVSVTQQMPGNLRVTLSYSASLGVHQRRARNINAPYPGTPLPDEILGLPRSMRQDLIDQQRPMYPYIGNVTQIETTGRSWDRTVRLRVQPRGNMDVLGIRLSGNVNYRYRSGFDDNDFNNPYVREWGPTQRTHSVQTRFQLRMPDDTGLTHAVLRTLARATWEGMSFNFNLGANTGRLYSIRSGRDLNGDQSSRDRLPGLDRNTEVGPASWDLDVTVTKDMPLGTEVEGSGAGGRGGRGGRFGRGRSGPRLRFQARINNLLNHTQPRAYGSVVTSPLFGLPTGYTGGRTIALSTSVDF